MRAKATMSTNTLPVKKKIQTKPGQRLLLTLSPSNTTRS